VLLSCSEKRRYVPRNVRRSPGRGTSPKTLVYGDANAGRGGSLRTFPGFEHLYAFGNIQHEHVLTGRSRRECCPGAIAPRRTLVVRYVPTPLRKPSRSISSAASSCGTTSRFLLVPTLAPDERGGVEPGVLLAARAGLAVNEPFPLAPAARNLLADSLRHRNAEGPPADAIASLTSSSERCRSNRWT
jgi:hypothetical protein